MNDFGVWLVKKPGTETYIHTYKLYGIVALIALNASLCFKTAALKYTKPSLSQL